MQKVNLEHELLEKNRKLREQLRIAAPEDAVSEVKGLIGYGNLEDSKILNNLGINSVNMKLQEGYGNALVMEKIEKATNLTVIHVSQIKELCLKYKLRLLPVKNYIGVIPSDIVQNIKALQQSKRESSDGRFQSFDEHQLQTEFYIMAPAKMFKLQEREKIARKNIFKMISEYFSDPIMFYRQDENHYAIVRKWGVDFSVLRRVLGFITQNTSNLLLTLITLTLFIGGLMIWSLSNSPYAVLLFIIVDICSCGVITANIHKNFYSENNWNSIVE